MILIPIIITAAITIATFHEPKASPKTTQELYREGLGHQK